jgi:hypothetical protein
MLHTIHPRALLVRFHNYNDSVMRVARILRVPTMHSRDILLQAKRDHLDRVHSDQLFLERIRQGRWSGRAVDQQRPGVSKLGLKGLSDYYSNKIAVEVARRGPVG